MCSGNFAAGKINYHRMTATAKHFTASCIAALGILTGVPSSAQEQADTADYNKFRFGGYGEIVAAFKDYGINRFQAGGATREHRNTISIPRFVAAFDYKFNSKWILGAEIEFESGGTGVAYELDNKENGEYEAEVEKGGEVAIEQFHITRLMIPGFNVRVGHVVLPVGLTNAHHEPINFFGAVRPESETTLLPSTWHETGIEFFGSFGRNFARFNYQAMITAGQNANGFDRDNWISGGKQGFFENDNFTSPAYIGRIDWVGVPGLRTGVSLYYCRDTGANADKPQNYSSYGRIPLTIFTWDARYAHRYLTARASVVYGNLGNSAAVNDRNGRLPGASPYSRLTPVGKNALAYGAEVGFNLAAISGVKKFPVIYPFARYEYYNPQQSVAKPYTSDDRLQVSKWTAGLNWFALPNLVVKADYCTRQIGTSRVFGKGRYTSENEFSIGVAYVGWFVKK